MTTVSPRPRPPARSAKPGARAPRGLTVSWSVSRAALAAAHPDWNLAAEGADPIIECTVEPGRDEEFALSLSLRDGAPARDIPMYPPGSTHLGTWTTDPDAGLEHLDIPGVLSLSIRPGGPRGPQVLFARTPALALLGLRGGRYQIQSGAQLHSRPAASPGRLA